MAHGRGIRVIYTAHGFHFYKGAPFKNWLLYYPVEKLLAHWTHILITVNREDEQFAKRHLRAKKIYRIPGVGIDLDRFQKSAAQRKCLSDKRVFCHKYQIPENAFVILSVGELSRRKNHQDVLNALAGILKDNMYYIICGQGALQEMLGKQAEMLGVAGHVRLVGFQENVESLYRHADLFVFPSLQEGMPVALMEAMAAGLPCVVSDIRGNRELIDEQGGSLFVPGQIGQMQNDILYFLDNVALREACGRHNQVKMKRYCADVVEKRMKKIYECMGMKQDRFGIPEVSVIMAVHDAADGYALKEAIQSVITQTFTDWELIICDDGSSDGTWKMLRQIAAADVRIRLLRFNKNYGAGRARNACIHMARGRYIAVMDADDISAPDRLRKQRNFLNKYLKYAFVGTRGEFFVHNVGDDGELYWYCARPQAEDFLFSLPFVHASIMFRKEALDRVCGYDSSSYVIRVEDYDLLLRLYAAGLFGANLRETLYYIRRDKDQYRRRKYRYRFHEVYIKCRGFWALELMPEGILYGLKPLLVGLMPVRLITVMQRFYYKKRDRMQL